MHRRDAFKALFGVPVLTAAQGRTLLVLTPAAIGAQRIYDCGHGWRFGLTVLEPPWPRIGDRVRFDHNWLHIRGTVTSVCVENVSFSDRVSCHIDGEIAEAVKA